MNLQKVICNLNTNYEKNSVMNMINALTNWPLLQDPVICIRTELFMKQDVTIIHCGVIIDFLGFRIDPFDSDEDAISRFD